MPTLLYVEGFRFFFFSNEGREPPHVHVEKGTGLPSFGFPPLKSFILEVSLVPKSGAYVS